MGRAKGFRLQAGFGIHLQRGVPGHKQGLPGHTQRGGACPQVVHTQVPAEACPSTSRTTSTLLWELQFSHLDNHLYSLSYGPTCAPVPHQGLRPLSDLCPNPAPGCAPAPRQSVRPLSDLCLNPAPGCAPAPRQSVHPLSDLCPQFPTETPVPRLAPPPSSHPHPRSFPSSDSFRLCPCRHPRRGRPRPRTHNSRACAKRSSPGSTRTNASCPCAHLEHRPGERWLAKL